MKVQYRNKIVLALLLGGLSLNVNARAVGDGCKVLTKESEQQALLQSAPWLQAPPEYNFTGYQGAEIENPAQLHVKYEQFVIAGCQVKLRQWSGPKWDGRPIGPTMRINPGNTYAAEIRNSLPKEDVNTKKAKSAGKIPHHLDGAGHGGESSLLGYVPPIPPDQNLNVPHNFNVTNLHTHGWHVDPTGISDNIFREMPPSDEIYPQRVTLPEKHPSGTFWYHAHIHGSTTLQVSSGMAGALIVEDEKLGLGTIPAVRNANEQIMIFQQLAYGTDGQIENYDNLQQGPYKKLNRPVFINGQAYPKLKLRVGELQRWRFIHAGITDGINPQLVKMDANGTPTPIKMYEISLDGLPTGTMPEIPYAVLAPGYRTDVLIQVLAEDVSDVDKLYLIDQNQDDTVVLQNGEAPVPNMRYILAQISLDKSSTTVANLPTQDQITAALTGYQKGDPYTGEAPLKPLTPEELVGKKQIVHYRGSNKYTCPEHGGQCEPCLDKSGDLTQCPGNTTYFMICDGIDPVTRQLSCFNFNPSVDYARLLPINSANEWRISGDSNSANHIYHIHVNPFQVKRKYAYGVDYDFKAAGMDENQWVWKDTLKAPVFKNLQGNIATIKTRYTLFTGAFVQHCHVLNHEDKGMMQVVSIEPTLEHLQKVSPELYEAVKEHGKIK